MPSSWAVSGGRGIRGRGDCASPSPPPAGSMDEPIKVIGDWGRPNTGYGAEESPACAFEDEAPSFALDSDDTYGENSSSSQSANALCIDDVSPKPEFLQVPKGTNRNNGSHASWKLSPAHKHSIRSTISDKLPPMGGKELARESLAKPKISSKTPDNKRANSGFEVQSNESKAKSLSSGTDKEASDVHGLKQKDSNVSDSSVGVTPQISSDAQISYNALNENGKMDAGRQESKLFTGSTGVQSYASTPARKLVHSASMISSASKRQEKDNYNIVPEFKRATSASGSKNMTNIQGMPEHRNSLAFDHSAFSPHLSQRTSSSGSLIACNSQAKVEPRHTELKGLLQRRTNRGLLHRFIERYFVLRHGTLSYWQDQTSFDALQPASNVFALRGSLVRSGSDSRSFSITPAAGPLAGKLQLLRAPDEEIASVWMNACSSAASSKGPYAMPGDSYEDWSEPWMPATWAELSARAASEQAHIWSTTLPAIIRNNPHWEENLNEFHRAISAFEHPHTKFLPTFTTPNTRQSRTGSLLGNDASTVSNQASEGVSVDRKLDSESQTEGEGKHVEASGEFWGTESDSSPSSGHSEYEAAPGLVFDDLGHVDHSSDTSISEQEHVPSESKRESKDEIRKSLSLSVKRMRSRLEKFMEEQDHSPRIAARINLRKSLSLMDRASVGLLLSGCGESSDDNAGDKDFDDSEGQQYSDGSNSSSSKYSALRTSSSFGNQHPRKVLPSSLRNQDNGHRGEGFIQSRRAEFLSSAQPSSDDWPQSDQHFNGQNSWNQPAPRTQRILRLKQTLSSSSHKSVHSSTSTQLDLTGWGPNALSQSAAMAKVQRGTAVSHTGHSLLDTHHDKQWASDDTDSGEDVGGFF